MSVFSQLPPISADSLPAPFPFMQVDRLVIVSLLAFHEDFLRNPTRFFIERSWFPVRSVWKGTCRKTGARTISFQVCDYKGIDVTLTPQGVDGICFVNIVFNPGILLYGHNGHILSVEEFTDALTILQQRLAPLLKNSSDSIDLIPGLRMDGPAYWDSIEIPFQWEAATGDDLTHFRSLNHPKWFRNNPRHWPTSMDIGSGESDLRIKIYNKTREMGDKGKLSAESARNAPDVWRMEVTLKEVKLVEFLKRDGNTRQIDGKDRLVSFLPSDLVTAHRKISTSCSGVFATEQNCDRPLKHKPIQAVGVMCARVARRTGMSVMEILSNLKNYGVLDDRARRDAKKAANAELSRLSSLSADTFLSDDAYRCQPSVLGDNTTGPIHWDLNFDRPPLIRAAYDEGYGRGPFIPYTSIPSYFSHSPAA